MKAERRLVQLKAAGEAEAYSYDCPFELKELAVERGTFAGYAAVFGNVDDGGDVIEPGAFKEIVTNDDGKVTILWAHDQRQPIGLATVTQDDLGLRFAGELVLEDPMARKALAHMKAGTARAMSFGYNVLPGGAEYLNNGVRKLTKLKLFEISVLTFGMNPLARVEHVKSALDCQSIREFEALCGTQLGLTRRKARRVAAAAWPLVSDREDRDEGSDEVTQLKAQLEAAERAATIGALEQLDSLTKLLKDKL